MENTIYLKKNGNFEYFVFKKPSDYDSRVISIDGVNAIARKSFKNAKSVEHIKIDNPIQRIEESAFEKCEDLKSVIFGNSKDISNELKEIPYLKTGDFTIQINSFRDCEKLDTVILPDCTNKLIIEKNAFLNCKNLRTVVFAYTWNVEIDDTAFIGCSNLTFICLSGSSAEKFAREHEIRIINY